MIFENSFGGRRRHISTERHVKNELTKYGEAFKQAADALKLCFGIEITQSQKLLAAALMRGDISQLQTGEGKTFAGFMASWALYQHYGRVTIITATEALAVRDRQWLSPAWEALGITDLGLIKDKTSEKQSAVTYASAKGLLYQHLLQNLMDAKTSTPITQGALLIDEADYVLMDQALQPATVTMRRATPQWLEPAMQAFAKAGERHLSYQGEENDAWYDEIEQISAELLTQETFKHTNSRELQIISGQVASSFLRYQLGENIIQSDDKIILIDQATGEQLPGRRVPNGIHQALEARFGLTVGADEVSIGRVYMRSALKAFDHVCGMSGTLTDASEFIQDLYDLHVSEISGSFADRRTRHHDRAFLTEANKLTHMADQATQAAQSGRAALLVFDTINEVQQMSAVIQAPHAVILGENDIDDAETLKNAGQSGIITLATRVAGRGVDIVPSDACNKSGGILLMVGSRMRLRRLDDQISGRVGRKGAPADIVFLLSAEDAYLGEDGKKQIVKFCQKLKVKTGEYAANIFFHKIIEQAQKIEQASDRDNASMRTMMDFELDKFRKLFWDRRQKIINRDFDSLYETAATVTAQYVITVLNEQTSEERFDTKFVAHIIDEMTGIPHSHFINAVETEQAELDSDALSHWLTYEIKRARQANHQLGEGYVIGETKAHLTFLREFEIETWGLIDQILDGIYLRSSAQRNPLNEARVEFAELFENIWRQLQMREVMTVCSSSLDIRQAA